MNTPMISTRLITLDDVPAVAALELANRDFLSPWMPRRDDEWFTVDKQHELTVQALDGHTRGQSLPHLIVDAERIVGRITLSGIVRGPFQSCSMGYWVAGSENGRGVATLAVTSMLRTAFAELGLHRVQAEILTHNTGSRRVLERNGFTRFGKAPDFLRIDGRWQDHELFQALSPDWTED